MFQLSQIQLIAFYFLRVFEPGVAWRGGQVGVAVELENSWNSVLLGNGPVQLGAAQTRP